MLKALGATVLQGDLRDVRSLKAVCRGSETVVTTASAMPFAYNASDNTPHTTDQDGYVSLVTMAREAGVQKFVIRLSRHWRPRSHCKMPSELWNGRCARAD